MRRPFSNYILSKSQHSKVNEVVIQLLSPQQNCNTVEQKMTVLEASLIKFITYTTVYLNNITTQ
jgi:hypothetical protein